MREGLEPPEDPAALSPEARAEVRTEIDVLGSLRRLGHEVRVIGLLHELRPLREAVQEFKPHLAFNLLEEFQETVMLDYSVVTYLRVLGVAYTGCNSRGMILGRDKALAKKILAYHRIRIPRFLPVRRGQRMPRAERFEALGYPLIVKSLMDDGSLGIAEASVVNSHDKLVERVEFFHRSMETSAIVEEYVPGRELYVTVMGHARLTVLPPWELYMDDLRADAPRIATRKLKFDTAYQEQHGVKIVHAKLPSDVDAELRRLSKRIYKALNLSGYARVDYRLHPDGRVYFLEANPNPDVALNSESVGAADSHGWSYDDFVARIVQLGLRSLG